VRTNFYSWAGPRPVIDVNGTTVRGPAFYYPFQTFRSLHLASYDAVREELPTRDLYPVRWFDGRAAVLVAVMRYHDIQICDGGGTPTLLQPYGEVMVAVPVTRRPRPRAIPALLPTLNHVGVFVLDLPVTTAEARDLGRAVWGLPKFVADMDFREGPTARGVTVADGDADVLTLEVRPSGPVVTDRSPVVFYSALGERLVDTTAPFLGHRQITYGRRAGHLKLGAHPVAERLRRLSTSAESLMVMSYLDSYMVLPAGEPVGRTDEYIGYVGTERPRGRLTVQYPGSEPVDQYTLARGILGH
jgi:hypothetical protein